MTKREKIIVGLVAAAIAGAAIDYTMTADAGTPAPGRDGAASLTDASAVIARSQATLASLQLDPAQERILDRLSQEWRSDLFEIVRPPPPPEPAADPTTENNGRPIFSGYLNVNGRSFAIIDGLDYAVGDWFGDGSFKITRITAEAAELRSGENGETLLLPLEHLP